MIDKDALELMDALLVIHFYIMQTGQDLQKKESSELLLRLWPEIG